MLAGTGGGLLLAPASAAQKAATETATSIRSKLRPANSRPHPDPKRHIDTDLHANVHGIASPELDQLLPMMFENQTYCAGTLAGVNSTRYGVGQRIALTGVSVSVVDAADNTVQVWGFAPCPPGMYCGAGSITTTLTWNGSPRPAPGDILKVYGVTITSFLRVDGSDTIWCPRVGLLTRTGSEARTPARTGLQ